MPSDEAGDIGRRHRDEAGDVGPIESDGGMDGLECPLVDGRLEVSGGAPLADAPRARGGAKGATYPPPRCEGNEYVGGSRQ